MIKKATLAIVLLGSVILSSCESKEKQEARIQRMVDRAVDKALRERSYQSYDQANRDEIMRQVDEKMRREAAYEKSMEEALNRRGGY